MENTYTYTARNAHDPQEVITFTLYDHKMAIELRVPLEQAERTIQAAASQKKPEIENRRFA